jgi:hypothetical protein
MEARVAYGGASGESGVVDSLDILTYWASLCQRKVYGSGLLKDAAGRVVPREIMERGANQPLPLEAAGLLL